MINIHPLSAGCKKAEKQIINNKKIILTKKQILVSLAAVLFAVLSVHSQETNEEVVGRL